MKIEIVEKVGNRYIKLTIPDEDDYDSENTNDIVVKIKFLIGALPYDPQEK